MALQFDAAAQRKMQELENQIAVVLARANEQKLEAGIAAFACVRCAVTLLKHYDPRTRDMLIDDVIVPFLRGERLP